MYSNSEQNWQISPTVTYDIRTKRRYSKGPMSNTTSIEQRHAYVHTKNIITFAFMRAVNYTLTILCSCFKTLHADERKCHIDKNLVNAQFAHVYVALSKLKEAHQLTLASIPFIIMYVAK